MLRRPCWIKVIIIDQIVTINVSAIDSDMQHLTVLPCKKKRLLSALDRLD